MAPKLEGRPRRAAALSLDSLLDDLGRKRVIQRRFSVGVPRARVPGKKVHASRPFREMITRRKVSQNEWKTIEI